VTAHKLSLLSWRPPAARVRAEVSTGYYVRSLARDLGLALGLGGGALSALRRLRVGAFGVERAIKTPESREALAAALLDPREALGHLPEIALDAAEAARLASGAPTPSPDRPAGGPYKIIGPGGLLIALAEIAPAPQGPGREQPRRPFLRPLRVLGPYAGPSSPSQGGE
jgi:tRNA U55 pseudouridine synthase TruB